MEATGLPLRMFVHDINYWPSEPGIPERQSGSWLSSNFQPGLVAVIVPTFNRSDIVIETLDSVCESEYRPIELIVVDDAHVPVGVLHLHDLLRSGIV